eukprot:jgi/Botrbrau1/2412/Bobra.0395s0040.1
MSSVGGDQLALFNQYDNEYCTKATDVARKIEAVSSLSGDLRKAKVREVETGLREAEQVLKRMEMEARSFSAQKSQPLLSKVKEYKADLAKLREDVRGAAAASSGGAAARAELGLADDFYSTSAGQRERVLNTTDRLSKTGDRIKQGRQQLLETEALGAGILQSLQQQRETIQRAQATQQEDERKPVACSTGLEAHGPLASLALVNFHAALSPELFFMELGVSILQDLHRQRQTITHARDTLHGADDNIAQARRVLAGMSRRITANKAIMFAIHWAACGGHLACVVLQDL